MKTRIIIFIAGIVFCSLVFRTGTLSENSAARDLAAAKSVAFGGVGVAGVDVRRGAEFASGFRAA